MTQCRAHPVKGSADSADVLGPMRLKLIWKRQWHQQMCSTCEKSLDENQLLFKSLEHSWCSWFVMSKWFSSGSSLKKNVASATSISSGSGVARWAKRRPRGLSGTRPIPIHLASRSRCGRYRETVKLIFGTEKKIAEYQLYFWYWYIFFFIYIYLELIVLI